MSATLIVLTAETRALLAAAVATSYNAGPPEAEEVEAYSGPATMIELPQAEIDLLAAAIAARLITGD